MSSDLQISITKQTFRKADINMKAISIRERLIRYFFGTSKRIIVLVPRDEIAEITVCRKGEKHGHKRTESNLKKKLTELSSLVLKLGTDTRAKPAQPEEPKITLKEIRAKLAGYSQAGFIKEIRDILTSFGASKLSEIKPELYPEVLAKAEKLND